MSDPLPSLPITPSIALFGTELSSYAHDEDIMTIKSHQKTTLESLSNAKTELTEFNNKAEAEYKTMLTETQAHQKMLVEMKQDLEVITKKIRALKSKLETTTVPLV